MQRTRVKICGIGRVEDALAAAAAGADAIGMVFVPGVSRNIAMERAAEILAALPPFVTPVGLFSDSPVSRVLEIASKLRLRHLQLQGSETPEQVAELKDYVIVKAIHADESKLTAELKKWRDANLPNLRGLLLETAGGKQTGGTGIENNWEMLRRHKESDAFEGLPPLIAAGGLKPETVAAVVKTLKPWAVDVSTGVESAAGIKSKEKIEAFIAAVRGAE